MYIFPIFLLEIFKNILSAVFKVTWIHHFFDRNQKWPIFPQTVTPLQGNMAYDIILFFASVVYFDLHFQNISVLGCISRALHALFSMCFHNKG